MLIKDKAYHILETICFTAGFLFGGLAMNDLANTRRAFTQFYIEEKGNLNKNTKSLYNRAEGSKKYGTPEGIAASTLGYLGLLARSRRKGKTSTGILEATCLLGTMLVGSAATGDFIVIRNSYVALNQDLPKYANYTIEERKTAREIINKETPYFAGETLLTTVFIYGATRKKQTPSEAKP